MKAVKIVMAFMLLTVFMAALSEAAHKGGAGIWIAAGIFGTIWLALLIDLDRGRKHDRRHRDACDGPSQRSGG